MDRSDQPLLIFDGDCSFCKAWIAQWKKQTGPRVRYAASQDVGGQYPQVPPEQFRNSVVLVEGGNKISTGAEAVFRSLSYAPGQAWWLSMYQKFPGFAPFTELMYRWVARNRNWLFMPRTR
jgi:predicted DCC family thiol-disulfide oxidoreductase YuxK